MPLPSWYRALFCSLPPYLLLSSGAFAITVPYFLYTLLLSPGAFAITVGLWIFGGAVGVNAVAAATVGLTILLVTNVITWKECLANGPAWDTLTWFAALIAMAAYLNKFGFIPWFSDSVVKVRQSVAP